MLVRKLAVLALTPLVFAAACGSDDSTSPAGNAGIRFVNLTTASLTFTTQGVVESGSRNLGYGQSTGCNTVNVQQPGIVIADANGATAGTFSGDLKAGGIYTVLMYADANGQTKFLTLKTQYPTSTNAGLRVVNLAGAAGAYDAYVTAVGAGLGTATATNVNYGDVSSFINTNPGSRQIQITQSGSQTVVANSGTQTLTAGRSALFVILPPASGSSTIRTLLVSEC